ncbi:MAG: bifunctional 2-C-methyl-D-erythritol 4-phosphate cytidylyltransferase/2-C-methyl-D-erythritol 2,4-cyclodiphosphate synthase [Pseudomonadota bacterium]
MPQLLASIPAVVHKPRMGSPHDTYVVIVAAGRGSRMAGTVPKQYRLLGGVPVLRRALLQVLNARTTFHKILVVIDPEHRSFYEQALEGLPQDIFIEPVAGGETRQESVFAALEALALLKPHHVVLHDAARIFVAPDLFEKTINALGNAKGAIAACRMTDTLKRTSGDIISETVARENLYAAQTPQAFDFETLYSAHQAALPEKRVDFTDDASLLEWQGHQVAIVESSADNFKLTTDDDWQRAEKLVKAGATKTALGFDVHRFKSGDHVMLGGVKIPHNKGIDAHSDGDVILHALTDAILGLIGAGDIGTHFPPSDAEWRGASSHIFVEKSLQLLHEKGGMLTHCDVTLISESPKIGPHRDKISASIAQLIDLSISAIGLKATTAEGLGMIGNGEGICAYVLVSARF